MIKKINDAGAENLCVGIINQAAQDYLREKKIMYVCGASRNTIEMNNIIRFFKSDWFRELTKVNGDYLIRRLDKHFEENIVPEMDQGKNVSFTRKTGAN